MYLIRKLYNKKREGVKTLYRVLRIYYLRFKFEKHIAYNKHPKKITTRQDLLECGMVRRI